MNPTFFCISYRQRLRQTLLCVTVGKKSNKSINFFYAFRSLFLFSQILKLLCQFKVFNSVCQNNVLKLQWQQRKNNNNMNFNFALIVFFLFHFFFFVLFVIWLWLIEIYTLTQTELRIWELFLLSKKSHIASDC